jgi:hypothetical protein
MHNSNITLPAGSFIENTDGVLPTVNNLGTNADLILALHTTSPHTLTFKGISGTTTYIITDPTADTGPITLDNAILLFQGAVAPSSSPITLMNNASFTATSSNRPLAVSNATLGNFNPGPITLPGLSLSDAALLQVALNSPGDPANTSFTINGNLTLDGILQFPSFAFAPGDYTLFSYTGALTDNGLLLPPSSPYALSLITSSPGLITLHVAAVPEPASLALLLFASPLLLRRKRA